MLGRTKKAYIGGVKLEQIDESQLIPELMKIFNLTRDKIKTHGSWFLIPMDSKLRGNKPFKLFEQKYNIHCIAWTRIDDLPYWVLKRSSIRKAFYTPFL